MHLICKVVEYGLAGIPSPDYDLASQPLVGASAKVKGSAVRQGVERRAYIGSPWVDRADALSKECLAHRLEVVE